MFCTMAALWDFGGLVSTQSASRACMISRRLLLPEGPESCRACRASVMACYCRFTVQAADVRGPKDVRAFRVEVFWAGMAGYLLGLHHFMCF